MKKCVRKVKEHTSECRFFFFLKWLMITELTISWPNGEGLTKLRQRTAFTLRSGALPKQNLRTNNLLLRKSVVNLLSEVCSFFFLMAFLHQRSYGVDMLGFLHASPIDFNTSIDAVCYQSNIRWHNEPSLFFVGVPWANIGIYIQDRSACGQKCLWETEPFEP